ncbi:MAG: HAMP domain-containing protein [Deltaproteobacteria bacterium]|nr:HAMP domain-containing protein [Deltaproteobacteria bacterium]
MRWLPLSAAVAAGIGTLAIHELRVRGDIEDRARALESIAAEAAARIDGDAHATVRSAGDPAFAEIRHVLRDTLDRHKLRSPIFTLRTVDEVTEFVVMTNETPYVGHRYAVRPEMGPVFGQGTLAHTGLYGDDHGRWISGYAPVKRADGTVEALVEVDEPGGPFDTRRVIGLAYASFAAFAGHLIAATAGWVSRLGVVRGLRALVVGRLATRIGVGGAIAVVLAVGVMAYIDHRDAERHLAATIRERLLVTARLAVPSLSPADVRAVDASRSVDDPAFGRLVTALRQAQERAGVTTPVYILSATGNLAHFVAMTNETPFVGHPLALRPGHQQSFADGSAAAEGPYTDAHGTWVSAWAPIVDDQGVAGLVQFDGDVSAMLADLREDDLRRAMGAILGVAVAFLAAAVLARGVARPIAEVADTARGIGEGRFDARLPEDREDEVGELSRAVNSMARGLRERERLRDMFGRYMTRQVAERLLGADSIEVKGELREITVVLSDIRGYTALTEKLGAAEVVALLNEYFAILVDEVVKEDGVIDKFMGDAMLCWFGAPYPQADHSARAVRAAAAIQSRLAAWNADRAARGLPPVLTGIGIASGEVVVGNIGSPKKLEYTAIGDAVNLASRLCSKADGGVVLATGTVRQAGGGEWAQVGAVPVKGVSEPVDVWRLGA